MPLYGDAFDWMRANFERIARGDKPPGVIIGTLTVEQLNALNRIRAAHKPPLPPVTDEVLFYGRHLYGSRVVRDGYTVEDVFDQIASAMSGDSVLVPHPRSTVLQNPRSRADRYGNMVMDLAVLECTAHHPRPELFSVMPKGDKNKPKTKKTA
jgi:hypothetical protein